VAYFLTHPVLLITMQHTEWPKKSKPPPNDQKIVLNRIKACE